MAPRAARLLRGRAHHLHEKPAQGAALLNTQQQGQQGRVLVAGQKGASLTTQTRCQHHHHLQPHSFEIPLAAPQQLRLIPRAVLRGFVAGLVLSCLVAESLLAPGCQTLLAKHLTTRVLAEEHRSTHRLDIWVVGWLLQQGRVHRMRLCQGPRYDWQWVTP